MDIDNNNNNYNENEEQQQQQQQQQQTPNNNNVLKEPTFNLQFYLDNKEMYPQYFIDALTLIHQTRKIDKTEEILLMSKTEIQRLTNLNIIQIDQLLLLISKNLMYNVYSGGSGGGDGDDSMNESNSLFIKPIELITSLEFEKLPISSIRLSSGCKMMDKYLGGGISPLGITEISGESGSGKTQLCIQLSLQVQLPFELGGLNGACLYINTESQFPMKRLKQMYQFKSSSSSSSTNQTSSTTTAATTSPLDNIFIQSVPTIDSLLDLLVNRITGYLEKKTVRLLIIDSIAALFRHEYGNEKSEIMEKTKLLWTLANRLKLINEQYGIAIVVVNQVTDFFVDSFVPNSSNNNNNNNNNSNEESSSSSTVNGELVILPNSNRPFKKRKQNSKVPSFQSSKQQHTPFILSQQPQQLLLLQNQQQQQPQQPQQTSSFSSTTIPALGLSWANFINTRFLLQRSKSTVSDPINNNPTILRRLKIILSSSLKNQTIPFIIDASGVKCYNK